MKKAAIYLPLAFVFSLALSVKANVLINDTWQDSLRNEPAAPTYAENNGVVGSDANSDGNIESVWFKGGAGTLTATPNDLQGTGYSSSSATWYTYFTGGGTVVNLANAGDGLKLTWKFTLAGINAGNTSQGMYIGVGLTPSGSRVTGDASMPNATYLGYAMLMNIAPTLGNSKPFDLRKWASPGSSGAFLGTSGNWTDLANGATSGNAGFANSTPYTYTMTLTRNASGGLDVDSKMTGAGLNGTGTEEVTYSDTTASQGFSFDTFGLRPSSTANTATTFDTSLFEVEYVPVPEPSTLALAGLGLALFAWRRKHC